MNIGEHARRRSDDRFTSLNNLKGALSIGYLGEGCFASELAKNREGSAIYKRAGF
jgi:hypothetical protein